MKKVLVICGPTATGKTSLAFHLAAEIDGELLSADSRQVYIGMDIGTGKDIPKGFNYQVSNIKSDMDIGYYSNGETRIWGYDLVSPKQEFSVAHFVEIGQKVIEDIISRNKIPIIVGGTGLYIRGLVDGFETVSIPPNIRLREKLEKLESAELFDCLYKCNPVKAISLNNSEKNNPRRLIRAIEISMNRKDSKSNNSVNDFDTLFAGLKASQSCLNMRIEDRVDSRILDGFENEIENLLSYGVSWKDKSMTSLGYLQWREYLENRLSKSEARDAWIQSEQKYAKRQMTWFQKDDRIHWFDVSVSGYKKSMERLVRTWHNKDHVREKENDKK